MLLFAKHAAMDLDDKALHWLLILGGMFLASFLKVGFDYIAKKTWRKIDHTAEELKAFKEWQKTHSVPESPSDSI